LGGALLLGKFDDTTVGRAIVGELGMFGEKERYPFKAKVVRLEPQGTKMAIQFSELSDGAFKLLQRYAINTAS
jgi:hypothetical protein